MQLKLRKIIKRARIHVCSFHFTLNIAERISINFEQLQKDNNSNNNKRNEINNIKLNQSFQIKSIFTLSKIKELLKENNVKFENIFKKKIQKIKSKNNFSSSKVNQLTSSNLPINKTNIKNTQLNMSLQRFNYNLLKNKKINYITLYDENISSEEIPKPHSKPISPRIIENKEICFSTKKVSKEKDNSSELISNLKKNLSSQIIITNHFNFYQNIITSQKGSKTDKGNKIKINNQRITNNMELKGYGSNSNTNNELIQRNNLKNNFLQITNNWNLLMNKSKGKINSNNSSSILFKNAHSKSSSVFLLPDSTHHSMNTSISHLQLNMKVNKKENNTVNPSTQNSRQNSKEKKQNKNQNFDLHSSKLIKSYEEKNILGKNFNNQQINNSKISHNTISKLSNPSGNYVKKKYKHSYIDNGIINTHFPPRKIVDISNVKSLLNNNSHLLKFKQNCIYSNNNNIPYNNLSIKNHNKSTKNTSLSNKSVIKRDETDKDFLKCKLDHKKIHKSSITTVPSKHNSNSTSRVEEQQSIITMNSKEKIINIYKDKIFPKTAAHSPTNTFKYKIIYAQNNSKQGMSKNSVRNNNINYKKKTIQKLNKNKRHNSKENNKNNLNQSKRINTNNFVVDDNLASEEVIKRNETEHITVEKLLNEEINYQGLNSVSSFKSFTKDKIFFRNERDKIAEYIRYYYENEGNYPLSKIHFYKYGRIIGKGAFGKVNIALHICSGQLVAIKSFNKINLKNIKARKKIDQEITIMKKIRNKFITQILDHFETDTHIFIVMEYVCEDLLNYISKRSQIPEVTAKLIFRQLIEGIQYLHSNSIIHRDIKLDNILLDLTNTVKICDFGVSRLVKPNDIMYDHCGTPAYIAPEIFMNKGYKGFTCDIWSAGITLYYMLSGNQPFKGTNISKLQANILEEKLNPIKGVSEEANHLIQRMLLRNPKHRITIEEILRHPWLIGVKANINENITIFTKAERILLSKFQADYLESTKDILIENFTESNINTINGKKKEEHFSKSLILTPYNTEKSEYNMSLLNKVIENSLCKFTSLAKQKDLKYQLNNNSEFDNGIINSENESYQKNLNMCNDYIYNNYYDESPDIDSYSPIYISPSNENKELNNHLNINYSIEEVDVHLCEKIHKNVGYKVDYLIECIRDKKVNYATATYYLLLKSRSNN